MNIIRRRGWEIPESQLTPEHLAFSRRSLLIGGAGGAGAGAGSGAGAARQRRRQPAGPDRRPLSGQARTRNIRSTGRSPTRRSTPTTTISTSSARPRTSSTQAQKLQIRPWTVKIDGMVEKPIEIGIDDLIRKMRHRGARSTATAASRPGPWRSPWTGFPLSKLVELAKPLARRNICRWKPSTIRRWRRASARPGIRGPTSKG